MAVRNKGEQRIHGRRFGNSGFEGKKELRSGGRLWMIPLVMLVEIVEVGLKIKQCYGSGEMVSERLGFFDEGMRFLFLLAITGSCLLVHDEQSANRCGPGVRSYVDDVVAAIRFETGLMVDDTVGSMVGGVDGREDQQDLVDAENMAGFMQARVECFMLNMSNLHGQNFYYSKWIIHLPWSLSLVPLISRLCAKITQSLSQIGTGKLLSSPYAWCRPRSKPKFSRFATKLWKVCQFS